ncbi:MAG: hypothetical protein M1269_00705 [Chloroflexi bacterium]|nr:hypothetical protein [Chloroflexota bacterium]
MKKTGYALCIFIALFIILSSVVFGASDTQSINQKDSVFISKITPRTSSIIVPPAGFPYYLEVEYSLVSTSRAYVEVGVYLKDLQKGAESKLVTKPRVFPVTAGKGALLVTTDVVNVVPKNVRQELLIVASLKNTSGNELAYSNSINMVVGNRKVIKSGTQSNTDSLQVLSVNPPEESSLSLGKSINFVFKINYGVMSRPYAFVNFEFSDASQARTGMAWYSVTVPLKKGKGIMEIAFPITFAGDLYGRRMAIGVPFRVEPLGGTSSYSVLQSYTFEPLKRK